MGDEKIIKLIIHNGGTMKKEDDKDYDYQDELDCMNVLWKLSEIHWDKFLDFLKVECVCAPINLIWYKKANEEMGMLKFVFDTCNYEMSELRDCAKSSCELDVFMEHECSEHLFADGYEPDEDERIEESENESDDGDRPPKEDDEPEDSDDKIPTTEGDELTEKKDSGNCGTMEKYNSNEAEGGTKNLSGIRKNENVNQNEVDDGDEVVVEVGDGCDDARFQFVFKEGTRRNDELFAVTKKMVEEQVAKEKEEEDEETDPEFGLKDVQYPDTLLESEEEWELWKNPNKEKRKDKFHGDLDKEPYIWLFQTFNSGLEFKDQLFRYSLNTQYDVKMAKSEANMIATICCKKECPWKVLCSVERPINKWMVKVCHYKHNHRKSSRVSMLKQSVIGGLLREEIRKNIHLQATEIKDIIKECYNIVTSIFKCYKGRRIALDLVLQAQTIQFGRLWDYEANLSDHIRTSALRL